ncbi:MAG: chemotaxis protein CheA [Gammaproteobacteria bacterium]|nr:chemotaxis protein CheA [Gammaproteobacteria bacterium]
MTIDMAQFHQVFFEESFEGLDIMESGLLDMEPGQADSEEINAIFRAAHSIKGGAGTFSFMDVANFTHVMETLLDEMRDGRRQVTAKAIDVLLKSVDVLRHMLTSCQDDEEIDQAAVAVQKAELERILSGSADDAGSAAQQETTVEAEAAPEIKAEERIVAWKIVFNPHDNILRTGNDPYRIIRELSELGDIEVQCDAAQLPEMEDYEVEDFYLSWEIKLNKAVEQQTINDIFDWVEDECDMAIVPITEGGSAAVVDTALPLAETSKPATGTQLQDETAQDEPAAALPAKPQPVAKAAKSGAAKGGGGSIRVDTAKIDSLINMVGELVITQSMLGMLGEGFNMSRVEKLIEGLGQLERHTRELQESVMQIRMLPISFTFSRFPRLVHDLSSKMGKSIELEMIGEDTEVDKTVIEKIGDPLVHLVRNSLDHGIEMPADRAAAGKPETGKIQLIASHKGGNIVIEIRDDGRGLNRDKILEKALEKGVISDAANLSDKQIYELIFEAGFSTADQVSDVSGRGVGMDVVRRNINELGGGIEIESDPGKGSAIIIRLPLTLAILDGQSINVGEETYIVPLVSIIESIQVRADMVNMVAGKGETFKLRDEYLPVIRLHEVFGIKNPKTTNISEGLLVVVEGDGSKCGLFVDDLLGQHQVVIKSLETNYKKVEGASGATILGDGSVALILDIPDLMRLAKKYQPAQFLKSA